MKPRTTKRNSGFTLLEMMVALALLVIVVANVYTLLKQSTQSLGGQKLAFDIDTQARRTMDRITLAIIGASEASLMLPTSEPYSTSELNFRSNLGLQGGVMVESDPQRIARTDAQGGEVSWIENPGTPNEKHIIWSKYVPPFLDGELYNGVDDNGNHLIDETGLSFVKEGKSVTIYLTLKRQMPDGTSVTRKLTDTVTCRN